MRIAGVAGAFPKQYFSQAEITAALKQRWADELDNPEVLDRLLSGWGSSRGTWRCRLKPTTA